MEEKPWWIFRGDRTPKPLDPLPASPSWRNYQTRYHQKFGDVVPEVPLPLADERGKNYIADPKQCDLVNTALLLRRPLLVTGAPGTGKTALAYAVAYELQLGPVLLWPITTRTTLQDALYRYDAIGRLQADAALKNARELGHEQTDSDAALKNNIGDFLRLGPLGTALLPSKRPRVLLIDEIDKSDIDLPNDLLHIFEEGTFEIPELARLPKDQSSVQVRTSDEDERATIHNGRVHCYEFPLVVMTSNGERDFPPAFLRRCLRLEMPDLKDDRPRLDAIIRLQLGMDVDPNDADINNVIAQFTDPKKLIATDQLLNALFLLRNLDNPIDLNAPEQSEVSKAVLHPLSQ